MSYAQNPCKHIQCVLFKEGLRSISAVSFSALKAFWRGPLEDLRILPSALTLLSSLTQMNPASRVDGAFHYNKCNDLGRQ